jgi:hypothetical protein
MTSTGCCWFLNERYIPKPGDYLERRGPDNQLHSMMMYRWSPGHAGTPDPHHRYNRAEVFNGPWPVTLRAVHVHKDEIDNSDIDFWLGRIDEASS